MNGMLQTGAASLDRAMMRRAIELARLGAGWTSPNPLVGAVITRDGRVIGEGFHERYGQAHAERNALAACVESPKGATLYVTLEPCCHWGKQPPCADAIVDAGIARVVVGSRDPNPVVSGGGVARLRQAGVHVDEDVLRGECDQLNPAFFCHIITGRPYVVAKWAMTMDGKIATYAGDSRWVSGPESRADVHELRHELSAVMVGIGTALADDPLLTARRPMPSNQPLRVVVDSRLRLPVESALVRTACDAPLLVATSCAEDSPKAQALRDLGIQVIRVADDEGGQVPRSPCTDAMRQVGAGQVGTNVGSLRLSGAGNRVNLPALMDELGARDVDSVLVEGGGTLHGSLFEDGLVDRAVVYVASKVAGGAQAKTPVEGVGVAKMSDACAMTLTSAERSGDDLKLTYDRVEAGEVSCSRE